jgi:hypothetical protein
MPCVALGCPTCGRADVPCVCVADLRWGTQLADVPCVALGHPTCGRVLCCIWAPILRTCLALHWGAQPWWGCIKKSTSKTKFVLIHPLARPLAYCSLGWTFSLRMSFAFGRPSWTCLTLRWGAQLADVRTCLVCIADVPWGNQLADVPCVALGCPTCRRALRCVVAPNLRTCLVLRLGTHLADVPCVAFGHPSYGRAFRCIRAPNLGEVVLKSPPPSQNLFLSILWLVFFPSAPLCGRFHYG